MRELRLQGEDKESVEMDLGRGLGDEEREGGRRQRGLAETNEAIKQLVTGSQDVLQKKVLTITEMNQQNTTSAAVPGQ